MWLSILQTITKEIELKQEKNNKVKVGFSVENFIETKEIRASMQERMKLLTKRIKLEILTDWITKIYKLKEFVIQRENSEMKQPSEQLGKQE